jgi:hypothetical protein
MKTLISRYKLLLVALLAAGCVSSEPGPSPISTPSPVRPVATASVKAPEGPGELQPGPIIGTDGKMLHDGGKLEFIALTTADENDLTIGVWTSLQPTLGKFVVEDPEYYENSVMTVGHDFIKVTPAKTMSSSKLEPKSVEVKPGAGIAYANSKGEFLVSLRDDAKPPDGFTVVGQGSVDLKVAETWKKLKSGVKVKSAGGLRH